MPLIGAVLLAINVALVVHTVKTGRFWPWAYVILMIPVAGAIAYVVVELVPEWLGTHKAQTARRRIGKALNPEKTYRALQDQVDIADTIANRDALAQECLALGKFAEAETQYEAILAQPLGDDPRFALGRAQAQFGLGRFKDAKATLDDLRQRWPGYGLLLRKLGRETEARAALTEVVRQMRRAPQFARKVQAEWIAMAEAALRG